MVKNIINISNISRNKFKIIILLFLLINYAFAQQDNIWMLGYGYPNATNRFYLDFTNGVPDTINVQSGMKFFITNTSICDSLGSLQIFTNGQWIANRNYDTLYNSSNFNAGWATDSFYVDGLGFSQGAVILPFPDNLNKYIIFSITGENYFSYYLNNDSLQSYLDGQPFHLSYSVIDMSLNNGLGGIDSMTKNVHAVDDTLILGRLTCCKHANGRDWWLITHKWYSDLFYKFLISPSGVSSPIVQQIGSVLYPSDGLRDYDRDSQAAFSPDGTKYIFVDQSNFFTVYDFDRCSGLLSNFRQAFIDTIDRTRACSISPNSNYAYVSTLHDIYQFDINQLVIQNTEILVAHWDSTMDSLTNIKNLFYYHQLAPDGKIYISNFGSSNTFHIIETPDLYGGNSNVQQHSFFLPGYNIAIPNFPNYKLGVLNNSICDTVNYTKDINLGKILKMYPNPASSYIVIENNLELNVIVKMRNTLGQILLTKKISGQMEYIRLSDFKSGIYLCEFYFPNGDSFNTILNIIK